MESSDKSRIYKKDDLLTVKITDIGNDGEGIGKIDGYTLFIKDAVIGDVVKAKIMKAKKNYAYAHLEEVVSPSKYRIEPKCPISKQCGGCQLQSMSYERQLRYKQDKVRNNLVRLGGFDEKEIDAITEPIMGMEYPFEYRNKAQFPIGKSKDGRIVAGFYAGHSHNIIPNTDCKIGTSENKEILEIIISYMEKNHVKPYDEATGKGLVRHVLIRKGFTSGEIMVCLVINYRPNQNQKELKKDYAGTLDKGEKQKTFYLPKQTELVDMLIKIKGMTSISIDVNTEKTNVIMGNEVHTIWGRDTIKDTLCGLEFNISPLSFYQVNPLQATKLYNKAIEYAALTGDETVWDVYCGIGTITLAMSKKAKKVYGVEIVPQAIEDAKENARQNNIKNAEFYVGKAEEVLPQKYADEGILADVVCVDPPRKGCDKAALDTILKVSPQRIVYVSCDSATLARDLRILCDGGYKLERIRTCDMFGWSVHVETVVLMSRVEGK